MKPRRAHSETRSSIRSRRRRFAGCSLDIGGRALYGGCRTFAPQHSVEESLTAKLDADVEALESAHDGARLGDRAFGPDQAVEAAHVERERAIERAQRSDVHGDDAAAPRRACAAHGPAVGDGEADGLLAGELAATPDAAP